MEYRFNNAIFTPDAVTKLTVDGIVKPTAPIEVKLLKYLLHHNDQIKHKDEILDAVWGPGQYSHHSVTASVCRLHKDLRPATEITTIRHQGHILSVDLVIAISEDEKNTVDWEALCGEKTQVIFEAPKETRAQLIYVAPEDEKTEVALVEPEAEITEVEPEPKKKIKPQPLLLLFLFITGLSAYAGLKNWISPSIIHTVKGIVRVFTQDYLVDGPQLSPDGNYIAHRVANKTDDNANLAITDLVRGETHILAEMKFIDGIKWSLDGNQIVYQYRADNRCQIRLITFNADKEVTENSLLAECLANSQVLSFAWFNEQEFYVNLVDSHHDWLPIHQLYSFNIKTKQFTKLISANNDEGVGFYSLEYDPSIEALYMLKTRNFTDTDFYRYQDGELTKLGNVDFPLQTYAVVNNRLVYKNSHNEFVINQPADDFVNQKILLPSTSLPMVQPHISGNKLTYLAGNTYGFELQKLVGDQLSTVELKGYHPNVMANYKNTLIFASDQTDIHQLYQLQPDQQVSKISDMSKNEYIKHIAVASVADMFAVNYRTRVDFYQYQQGQLTLLHSLPGYSNAYLSADGQRVLVSQVEGYKTTSTVIEMRLSDWQPTGLALNDVVVAMYYQGDVVYVDKNQQLLRYDNNNPQLLATGINIHSLEQTTLQGDKLYYIAKYQNQRSLWVYDLIDDKLTSVALHGIDPTRVEVINDEIFIRSRQILKSEIMTGEIVAN